MSDEKWNVFYDNDVGADDEGFWEWWEVVDADDQYSNDIEKRFKCDREEDAEWLADILNKQLEEQEYNSSTVKGGCWQCYGHDVEVRYKRSLN